MNREPRGNYWDPITIHFGCLPPLPDGWVVKWHPSLEHYVGHGPNEYETAICWDRFRVRRWLIHAAQREEEE